MERKTHVYSGFGSRHTNSTPASSKKWTKKLERVMQRDQDFFLQNPTQDFYIRSITPAEVLEAKSKGNLVSTNSMMLVGEIGPGTRARLNFEKGTPPPIADFEAIKYQFRPKSIGIRL